MSRMRGSPTAEAKAFNELIKVGDLVEYAEVIGDKPKQYRTRSEAQILSGHTAVVWLEGKTGCVCCSHVTKLEAQQLDDSRKAKNTQHHIESIGVAVEHFKKWPCITTINNIRLALDLAEKDFKAGDAKVAP